MNRLVFAEFAVEEVVEGFSGISCGEFFHAALGKEGMGTGHGGDCFGVTGGGVLQDAVNQDFGQAQATIGGVNDQAGDGAEVLVDETEAILRREAMQIERAVAGGGVEAWIGEDGDGDGLRTPAACERNRPLVADGPDLREGGGAAGAVVETLECGVVSAGAGGEDEAAGEEVELGQNFRFSIFDFRFRRSAAI